MGLEKKIILPQVPQQVLTDQNRAFFPKSVNQSENGLQIGMEFVSPVDPVNGLNSMPTLINPSTLKGESIRTPTFLVTIGPITAAGDTVLVAAVIAKKIRLLGYSLLLDPATTAAASRLLTLKDDATVIDNMLVIAAAAPAVAFKSVLPLPSNGWLMAVINKPVNINLSGILTAGGVYVTAWGCYE